MAATLIQRCMCIGDWENDGGGMNPGSMRMGLLLHAAGVVDEQWLLDNIHLPDEQALTQAQQADLSEIVATMPAGLVTPDDAAAKAMWAAKVEIILLIGREQRAGFTTEALVRTALGL